MRPSLLCLVLGSAWAASLDKPHPHQGKLAPIASKPPATALSTVDREALAAGQAIEKQVRYEGGGRALAIQDIRAPASLVWDAILDYDRYPDRVAHVESTEVYARRGDHWLVAFELSLFGIGVEYYTDNLVKRDAGWMSWTLDYSRKSDVDDIVGYWLVTQVSDSPPITRLEYASDMRIKWAPDFIVRYLARDALTEGTAWVKLHAERAAAARP